MNIRIFGSLLIFLSSYGVAQRCNTSVMVNAFDARTRESLRGLRASDFVASSGRGQITIETVKPVYRNRVLVLLDVGGRDRQSRDTFLQSTIDYLAESPDGLPVALGAFAKNAAFTGDFYRDPESLAAALKATANRASALEGTSNVPAALRQAISMFGTSKPGDTILLVGSVKAHINKSQLTALMREFSKHDVRLQLLMAPAVVSSTETTNLLAAFNTADHVDRNLVKLANSTGGVLMGFMNSDWYNVAASGYLLEVSETQTTKVKNWRLRVRDYDDEFGVSPVLFYPRQLPACSVPLVASAGLKQQTPGEIPAQK